MIEVRNLTKRYGTKTAIADVTFSVEKGEVLGFLGPNGAGKTTRCEPSSATSLQRRVTSL